MILLDLANLRSSHSNPDLYDVDIIDIGVMYIARNVITKSWYRKKGAFIAVTPYLQQTLQRQQNFINDLRKTTTNWLVINQSCSEWEIWCVIAKPIEPNQSE